MGYTNSKNYQQTVESKTTAEIDNYIKAAEIIATIVVVGLGVDLGLRIVQKVKSNDRITIGRLARVIN